MEKSEPNKKVTPKTNTEQKAAEIASDLRKKAQDPTLSPEEKNTLINQAELTENIAEEFGNFIKSQNN